MAEGTEAQSKPQTPPTEPIDVIDGVPDRAAHVSARRLVMMAVIFLAWVGFLVYCLIVEEVHGL